MAGRDHLAEQLRTMAPHRAVLRAVECRLMNRIELRAPVLDVGAGDGHFASIAYETILDVGLDPSAADLEEARSRPGVYRHVICAQAGELPFCSGSFNTVVSNSVLEHVPGLDAGLEEICRVLEGPGPGHSGGLFVMTTPSEHFAEFLLGTQVLTRLAGRRAGAYYGRFFNRISKHHHVYPAALWRDKLEAAGFIVEEISEYFSAAAHRRFDASHYLGVPNLLSRKLLGRWVPFDGYGRLFDAWLRPAYEEEARGPGAYLFIRCRKR